MLQHAAEDLVPGTLATRVEAIRAFKWLTVQPPTAVTVRATRDGDGADPDTGETSVKASIDKHARATVIVASVAMNGAIWKTATSVPEKAPSVREVFIWHGRGGRGKNAPRF